MSSLHPVQTTLPGKALDAIAWGKADGEAGSNRPFTSSDEICRNRNYIFKHTLKKKKICLNFLSTINMSV